MIEYEELVGNCLANLIADQTYGWGKYKTKDKVEIWSHSIMQF